MELAHRAVGKPEKGEEHDSLREQERRLGTGRRQRMQQWVLLEGLHHEHEDVERERKHRAYDIDPAPRSLGTEEVEGDQRRRQNGEGNRADDGRGTTIGSTASRESETESRRWY